MKGDYNYKFVLTPLYNSLYHVEWLPMGCLAIDILIQNTEVMGRHTSTDTYRFGCHTNGRIAVCIGYEDSPEGSDA